MEIIKWVFKFFTKFKKYKVMAILWIFIFQIFLNSSFAFADNMDKVTLQLRWNHQFQFAGYYAAKWLGYYEDEGLDVDIKSAFTEDGKILDATQEVKEDRAHFGIGAVDILIEENKGADFCVVSSIFQRSTVEFYMKKDTPYQSLVDLTKLNTARRRGDLLDIELQAMLISEGITPRKNNLLKENEEFSLEDLIEEKYDVIPGYLGTISFYAERSLVPLKVIKPIDYGIDFYGDSLFTTRSFANKNPKLVENFRRASMKGWEYALEHPSEIAQRIAKEFPIKGKSQDELMDYNKFQAQKVLDLTFYPVVEIGNINPYRWGKMEEVLKKLNLVEGDVNLDRFIFNYEKIKSQEAEKYQQMFIVFVIICFISLIAIFLFHLTGKNRALEREVMERSRAEENIKRSKQRYEAIFNSALLGITVTTVEGSIIQANDKWTAMSGYSLDEVVGRNILDFIHDDFTNQQMEISYKFKDEEINNFETERKYVKKDGSIFWGKLFMTTIYDQNNDEKVNIGMVVDITNRKIEEEAVKRSEKRFRKIVKEVASEISDLDNRDDILPHNVTLDDHHIYDEKSKLSLKLEKINLQLENMFKKELDENKRKEALIIYQARLAAMGEMIGNIAHQWRQPLNTLGLILSNIKDAYQYDELDGKYLDEAVDKSRNLIGTMSETIDDFRYFLNPKDKKQSFSIYKNINAVLDLVEDNLKFNNIVVKFEDISLTEGYGYANQFFQAILNIINNSIDVLISKDIEEKFIKIRIYDEGGNIAAEFRDNGGGISEEVADKIFDIYFTTKKKTDGTGLGLYMTKTIIENNMDGKISWRNDNMGVIMKVSIPKNRGNKSYEKG